MKTENLLTETQIKNQVRELMKPFIQDRNEDLEKELTSAISNLRALNFNINLKAAQDENAQLRKEIEQLKSGEEYLSLNKRIENLKENYDNLVFKLQTLLDEA